MGQPTAALALIDPVTSPARTCPGRLLPSVRRPGCPVDGDAAFDAGYCIGRHSIVGLEPCLRELRCAVRPGGVVVVSDLYWRRRPGRPLGPQWGWVAEVTDRRSLDEYRRALERAGVALERRGVEAFHGYMTMVARVRPRGM